MARNTDRRRSARVHCELPLRCKPAGSEQELIGTVRNLSLSGVRIDLPQEVAPGTLLELTLELPEAEGAGLPAKRLKLEARAQWSLTEEAGGIWPVGANWTEELDPAVRADIEKRIKAMRR